MDIIKQCILFSGLEGDDFSYALEFFNGRRRFFRKGDYIKSPSSPLTSFGLVISGAVEAGLYDIDGQQMILANVAPGETFGESICFLRRESDIYITAASDSSILMMNTDRIQLGSSAPDMRDAMLANRFTAMLANRTLSMNDRIQILSKLTLREKLMTFFTQWAARCGSREFTVPFDRATMAKYLGTDRSALSRELSHMRKDGLISFSKSHFIVL
jgi:CRP/FNR family transcriptional regulator, dissimilatory nitrate respiration regulator